MLRNICVELTPNLPGTTSRKEGSSGSPSSSSIALPYVTQSRSLLQRIPLPNPLLHLSLTTGLIRLRLGIIGEPL